MNKNHLVLLLHGLGNSKSIMSVLGWYLRRKGFSILNIGYPSLAYNSQSLAELIGNQLLKEWQKNSYESASIIGFSLGSQIARIIISQYKTKINFSRLIMLGPPNQGAAIARRLKTILPTTKIWGPVFDELCSHSLPNPCDSIDVGIIAGGTGINLGINPLLKGDNDGLVRVQETFLTGSKEHKLIFAIHGTMPLQPKILRMCERFLISGKF